MENESGGGDAKLLASLFTALFGKNADYAGDAMETMPLPRSANVLRICQIALRRLGEAIAEPGNVHPGVIHSLLTDGSNVIDRVAAEYWGGVLACARGLNDRDDRAVRKMKMLARLGEYDIRSHYLFYTTLRLLLRNRRPAGRATFEDKDERFRLAVFIPAGYYILSMDYNKSEIDRMPRIIGDMLVSLGMEFLVDGSNTGSDEYLKKFFTSKVIRGEGIVFSPGVQGVQLLLWAFGRRDMPHAFLADDALDCRIPGVPMGVDEAGLVYFP